VCPSTVLPAFRTTTLYSCYVNFVICAVNFLFTAHSHYPSFHFYCDDFELSYSLSSTARMDQTRIDDRIDASARVGDVPSSPTRSPLHLASLSSEPLGSPYTDGSPNTAAAGLGISLRDSVRDDCFGSSGKSSLRICDQSCSALNRRLLWFSRRMLHFGSASKN
jgi:hypothetical protein